MIGRASLSPAAVRLRMAAAVPLLVGRRDDSCAALARALRNVVMGRTSAGEREWIERIEARRWELASGRATVPLEVGAKPDSLVPWSATLDRPEAVPGTSTMFSVPPVWGRFLMRLVIEHRPGTCLELGTGFGISGAYLAAALELNGTGAVTTVEGAAQPAALARQGFSSLGLSRVETRLGLIDEELERLLGEEPRIDFAFVDAEHQEAPTVGYFATMLPRLAPGAIVVFDDVRWGDEMKAAWRTIRRRSELSAAVGLGRMGAVVVGPS